MYWEIIIYCRTITQTEINWRKINILKLNELTSCRLSVGTVSGRAADGTATRKAVYGSRATCRLAQASFRQPTEVGRLTPTRGIVDRVGVRTRDHRDCRHSHCRDAQAKRTSARGRLWNFGEKCKNKIRKSNGTISFLFLTCVDRTGTGFLASIWNCRKKRKEKVTRDGCANKRASDFARFASARCSSDGRISLGPPFNGWEGSSKFGRASAYQGNEDETRW